MPTEMRIGTAISARPVDRLEGRRLTLLLHGFGSHERDLLPLAAALPQDDAVVSLRAPLPAGPGFAWAPVRSAVLDDEAIDGVLRGRGLAAAADAVLRWLDEAEQALGTPDAVRLLGFSQGGATALTMLRRAPGRFDRVVVLAGFVPEEAEGGDAALAADPPPVLWGRGDADDVIPTQAVDRTAAWLRGHAAAEVHLYPGLGHGVSDAELTDVAAFLR